MPGDPYDRRRRLRQAAARDTGTGYAPGTRARVVSPGQAARGAYSGTGRATEAVTERPPSSLGSRHLLTAELLAGMVIVLIRIVADYEPQSNGTVKGKIGHPMGQYGPIPIAAGLIGTFFFLSFLVAKGGKWATFGNSFGALVIIALALKSADETEAVISIFPSWGKGSPPPGTTAASWDTTGQVAGDPLSASSSTPATGSTPALNTKAVTGTTTTTPSSSVPGEGVVDDIINPLLDAVNPIKWLDGSNLRSIKETLLSGEPGSGINPSGAASQSPTGSTNPK